MNLFVNQRVTQAPEKCSLAELLSQLKINNEGIAVAIGQEIIAKENWDSKLLKENDSIMIITATQGG